MVEFGQCLAILLMRLSFVPSEFVRFVSGHMTHEDEATTQP
jgi:hypothetical protein